MHQARAELQWLFTVPSGASGRLNIDSGAARSMDLILILQSGQSSSTNIVMTNPSQSGKLAGLLLQVARRVRLLSNGHSKQVTQLQHILNVVAQ
jgi:hypothetical protein